MTAAEIYARAISEQEDNGDVDNLSQDGNITSESEYDSPTANKLNTSSGAESNDSGHASDIKSESKDPIKNKKKNTVSIGVGTGDKTGGLLIFIRLLLILNFFISSSFFVYLVWVTSI